jgi:mono/diheme cytochrome c family protein
MTWVGASSVGAQAPGERAATMSSHFDEATRIHTAVMRGDLSAAREAGRRLAASRTPDDLPTEARRLVGALSMTAAQVSTAADLGSAAAATASLLVTCGECHRATGRMPAPAAASARRTVGGLVGHMLEHDIAADEMFRGLVIPSASSWREGAKRLRTAPLRRSALSPTGNVPRPAADLEKRVHAIAAEAAAADNQSRRATIYADFISQCAGCHALHPNVWGPPPR